MPSDLNGAGLLGILFGLLFIIGAVLVWIQLLVRAALIYIVIAFAPILWVTRAYPGTRNISRRGIEIALSLIVSKFVMAVSFRLGAEALRGGAVTTDEVDLSAMLVGAAIMLLTAFMPFAVFKVIPIVESATAAIGCRQGRGGCGGRRRWRSRWCHGGRCEAGGQRLQRSDRRGFAVQAVARAAGDGGSATVPGAGGGGSGGEGSSPGGAGAEGPGGPTGGVGSSGSDGERGESGRSGSTGPHRCGNAQRREFELWRGVCRRAFGPIGR